MQTHVHARCGHRESTYTPPQQTPWGDVDPVSTKIPDENGHSIAQRGAYAVPPCHSRGGEARRVLSGGCIPLSNVRKGWPIYMTPRKGGQVLSYPDVVIFPGAETLQGHSRNLG